MERYFICLKMSHDSGISQDKYIDIQLSETESIRVSVHDNSWTNLEALTEEKIKIQRYKEGECVEEINIPINKVKTVFHSIITLLRGNTPLENPNKTIIKTITLN